MKKIILFVIFLCLFPIKAFASGYEEITGGTINIKLHLVDTNKHERSIFDSSHFVLDIQGEEGSEFGTGVGNYFIGQLVNLLSLSRATDLSTI